MTEAAVTVYGASDDRYVTGWQLDRRIETGRWRLCLLDRATGDRLVERSDGRLLYLTEISLDALPPWVDVRADGDRVRAVDVRRTAPSRRAAEPADPRRSGPQP